MKQPILHWLVLIACVTVGLSACGDPREPTRGNFRRSIEAHFEGPPHGRAALCLPIYRTTEVEPESYRLMFSSNDMAQTSPHQQAALDAPVEAGVLQLSNEKGRPGERERPRTIYTIAPTHRSGIFFRRNRSWLVHSDHLCVGRVRLESIERWTEPADFLGMRISQVTVKMRYVDLPKWLSLDPVAENWRHVLEGTDKPIETTMTLHLTSDGWKVVTRPW